MLEWAGMIPFSYSELEDLKIRDTIVKQKAFQVLFWLPLKAKHQTVTCIGQRRIKVQLQSSEFRRSTDAAWATLMEIQPKLLPSKPRSESLNSIFRQKRQGTSQLPAWCQCEVTRPVCAPGPPGPTGARGTRGPSGLPGRRGSDNYEYSLSQGTYYAMHPENQDGLKLLPPR
ncbi:hypothetical protein TELCIR_10104 [Teladorsagia circumcincta]|uniref:Collagen triple helix repeat protein n=1 Tax=Teladorsagia circumcincta TaxID=45464 RepID=A0A2G9UF57_TELCI|nr:hypothetical protein TELCIR_10104 [Teladorsagia circumcincta]